ncbi:ABC transporter [Desulfonema ishimotonii]|uniref:ABC transporter n=2 Tax=Desulfonema ishimotonii TaxID=45657 RepID=A0A401FRX1_9BACT|nr:ABC transporter [Desulfonema ishimotonii]
MVIGCLLLSGCATQQQETFQHSYSTENGDHLAFLDVYDPLEPLNRRIYKFNTVVDNNILEPVVRGYKKVVPSFIRTGLSNFFSNIGEIPVMLNCLLQTKSEKSGEVLARFMVNTTAGIFGFWDPATNMGLIKYNEDFGQTLAVYGVPAGPYIVLPILGPSTLRDTTGKVMDNLTKTAFVELAAISSSADLTLSVVDGLTLRASLPFSYGDFDSPFEYDLVRALYIDTRNLLINDGAFVETHFKAREAVK